jgi:hypothetical protein
MFRISSLLVVVLLLCSSKLMAEEIPDLSKTPGVSRPGLTKSKVCSIKWGRDERHVTSAMKQQVFANYGFRAIQTHAVVPMSMAEPVRLII